MRASPRRFIAVFIASLAVLSASLALFNFVVDPLQYYRVSALYRPVFWGGMQRFQVPGLARNYARDIVVVGTSITENFLIADVERAWQRPAIRLSVSGSTAHEQFLTLRLALMTGHVTDVIWGLDVSLFYGPADAVRNDPPFPYYLYRTLPLPNPEYLLSLSTTRLSYLALRGYGETDLDKYHTWYDKFEFGEQPVLQAWTGLLHHSCKDFAAKFDPAQWPLAPKLRSELDGNIEQNMISLIKTYPAVKFHLFLPPMARIAYIPRAEMLPVLLAARQAIVEKTAPFGNAMVYDFQSVDELADIARYKDTIHFNLTTTEYIIEAIRDGKHRLTGATVAATNRHLVDAANTYDLCRKGGPLYSGGE